MSLCIQKITKAFNERVVLKDVSYEFPETGLFAFVANSGEGKTTLLRILAGLLPTDGGSIEGDDRVAVAFQEHRLLEHLTALQNLTHILYQKPAEHEAQARRMLARFQLNEQEQNLYPRQLSGGMKQRVSLCRAFLFDAPVLLLDEPFKELDPDLCERVLEQIKAESQRRLVILTAHSEQQARSYGAEPILLS